MAKCTVKEIRAEEEAIRRRERKEKMLEQKRKNREESEARANERAVRQKILEELLKVTGKQRRKLESKTHDKRKAMYKCECGSVVKQIHLIRHLVTLKHRFYVEDFG